MRSVRSAMLLAALVLAPVAVSAQTAPPPKRVLVLYDNDRSAPGLELFTRELRGAVQGEASLKVEFYEEMLDLDRFPGDDHIEQLRRAIAEKYTGVVPDAILAQGAYALRFAVDQLGAVFPRIPVVYAPVWEPVVDYSALPAHVTGRRQPLPFAPTWRIARALHPDAERLILVGGSSERDSLVLDAAVHELEPLLGDLELQVWRDWSYDSLLRALRVLPPRSVVLLSTMRRDRSGQVFITADLVAGVTAVASAPVYGISRNWLGDGIVGGAMMDLAEDGVRTGRILVRVLTRAPGERMPPRELASLDPAVDARELERWGLSEALLPPGTEVAFRTPTLWERYRTVIEAALALIAAQFVLIALLLVERRRRIRAQLAAGEVRDQLARIGRVATLGELTAAVSHELRQPLAAMRAHAEAGELLLRRSPPRVSEARDALAYIVSENVRAADVLDHIRTLMRKGETVIRPLDLNDLCRRAAVLLRMDADRRGVQLRTSLHPNPPSVQGDAVQLQQVILNLTLNAMDAVHGSARDREVVLGTTSQRGGAELFVSDNGPGLQPEVQGRIFEPFFSTKDHGLGMGLAIVRSIVERHNGRVRAENLPNGGALFRVCFPPPPGSGEIHAGDVVRRDPQRVAAL